MMIARGREERKMGSYSLIDTELQFEKIKKFCRRMVVIHNNVDILNATELYSLKWSKW